MSVDEEKEVQQWIIDGVGDVFGPNVAEADRIKHVLRGPFRPIGATVLDPSAWVLASGGEDIRRRDWREERPGYSILVRSPPRDYEGGRRLVSAIEELANNTMPPGFFDCHVVGGRAHYLRQDDQDQHLWSINLALKKSA